MSKTKQSHKMTWGIPAHIVSRETAAYTVKNSPGTDIFVTAAALSEAFVGTNPQTGQKAIIVFGNLDIGSTETTAFALSPETYRPEDIETIKQQACTP